MRCDEVASTGPIFIPVVELFSARFVSTCSRLVQKSRHHQDSNLHPPDLIHDELDHRATVPCSSLFTLVRIASRVEAERFQKSSGSILSAGIGLTLGDVPVPIKLTDAI